MALNQQSGLRLAFGVATGSTIWCLFAAGGLATLIVHQIWLLEIFRYVGAMYLMTLAVFALRSSFRAEETTVEAPRSKHHSEFWRGLIIHLANPKPILFYSALFSVMLPPSTDIRTLAVIVTALCLMAFVVFSTLALIFAHPSAAQTYLKCRRWFEMCFAALFGAACLKLLLTPLVRSSDP